MSSAVITFYFVVTFTSVFAGDVAFFLVNFIEFDFNWSEMLEYSHCF